MRALSFCLLAGVVALPAMAQDLALNGNSRRERIDCGGRNVVVTGNSNEYVLAGGCRAVSVNGNANRIEAELAPGAAVDIRGDATQFGWMLRGTGAAPRFTTTGAASTMQPIGALSAIAAAPPAAPDYAQRLGPDMAVVQTDRGLMVTLPNDVLFGFDQDSLRQDSMARLSRLAEFIREIRPARLRVIGYTDDTGAEAYNLDLSARRARSVERWLVGQGRVDVPVTIEGRGEANPAVPNTNDAARARNRRVEVLLER